MAHLFQLHFLFEFPFLLPALFQKCAVQWFVYLPMRISTGLYNDTVRHTFCGMNNSECTEPAGFGETKKNFLIYTDICMSQA